MLKILIVDDEPLVRNYIRSAINFEAYGFYVCGEASNGAEAIKLINSLKPDIVILDVHMPVMDGVSLSNTISMKYKNVKMIVLSSYDNFDYVRKTLKNGALDYLLKHRLDSTALINVLEKAKEHLNIEETQKKEYEKNAEKLEMINSVTLQASMRDLVLGIDENCQVMQEYFDHIGFNKLIVTVMQVKNFSIAIERFSDRDKCVFIKSVLQLCNQVIGGIDNGLVSHIDGGRFVILLKLQKFCSAKAINSFVDDIIRRMEKTFELYMGIHIAICTSSPMSRFEEIHDQYRAICNMVEEKLTLDFAVIDVTKRNTSISQEYALTIGDEKKILSAIEIGNRSQLDAVIDSIFSELDKYKIDYRTIQKVSNELINIVCKVGAKNGIDLKWLFDDTVNRNWCRSRDFKDIKLIIKGLYNKLMEDLQDSKSININNVHIKRAIQYISLKYMENISLEQVADSIGITSSYLSRLFKEEIGLAFVEYLNNTRIEASKKIIESGDECIKDIYSKVGFNNFSYFIKVFKQTVGETPFSYLKSKEKCVIS